MKENIKLAVTLFLITSVSGLLLAFTHGATKDTIAEREKMDSLQLSVILPESKGDNVKEMNVEIDKDSGVNVAYEVYSGQEVIGHAIIVSPKGVGGNIKMSVGITKEGKIGGLKTVSHSETPGIGDIVEKESFMGRFRNKPIKEALKAVKSTPSKENEIEAVSGATITSAAVTSGVNKAIEFYNTKVLGQESTNEKKEITAKDIMPEADNMKDIDIKLTDKIASAKGLYKGDTLLGYAIVGVAKGMDEVQTMVGISLDGKIIFAKVTEQCETEGLGDDILKDEFISKFKGKNIAKPFKTVKKAPSGENEIEALSGATISTDAVVNGVNEAIKFFNTNLKK